MGFASADSGKTEVVVLAPALDEVQQITDTLAGRTGIAAIHIFSHGFDGTLELGLARIDAAGLDSYSGQFEAWGKSLNPGADILIYGCKVGLGQEGDSFLSQMSTLTGADVSASTDDTGSPQLGGNWQLEKSTGPIDAGLPASAAALDGYQHLLSGAISWDGGGDSVSWRDAKNWSGDVLPGVNDDVTIGAVAGDKAININGSAGLVHVNSLNSSRSITLSSGATLEAATIQISKNMTLAGGTIQGGTVTATDGAALLLANNNTAGAFTNGVTLNGDMTVSGTSAALRVAGGLTLNGVIHLTGSNAQVRSFGDETFGGAGTVAFEGTAGSPRQLTIEGISTLTLTLTLTLNRQVAFEFLECLLDFGELDVSATAAPGRRL